MFMGRTISKNGRIYISMFIAFILGLFFCFRNWKMMDSKTRKYLPTILMFYILINFCGEVPAKIHSKIHSKTERLKKDLYDNHINQKLSPPVKKDIFYFVVPYMDVISFQLDYNDIFLCDPYYSPTSICERRISSFLKHFHIYKDGHYEIENVRVLKEDIVIDAGAHMGTFSLLAMNQGAKKVYAFEPNPRIYNQCLKAHVELNHGQDVIIPIPYGLGAKEEEGTFVDDARSACSHITNLSGFTNLKISNDKIITVNITTLDAFVYGNNIMRVDFIKADIEGAERLMLKGARNTIKQFHPRLAICTYHLPDDKEILTKIIRDIDPSYNIRYTSHKLYAW